MLISFMVQSTDRFLVRLRLRSYSPGLSYCVTTVCLKGPNMLQVSVRESTCEKCSSYEVFVEFSKDSTPFADGETKRISKFRVVFSEEHGGKPFISASK